MISVDTSLKRVTLTIATVEYQLIKHMQIKTIKQYSIHYSMVRASANAHCPFNYSTKNTIKIKTRLRFVKQIKRMPPEKSTLHTFKIIIYTIIGELNELLLMNTIIDFHLFLICC